MPVNKGNLQAIQNCPPRRMIFRKVTQALNPSQQVGVVNVELLLMSAAEAVADFLMFPVQQLYHHAKRRRRV
jgi:hypothetical protein